MRFAKGDRVSTAKTYHWGVLRLRDHLNRLDELRGFGPAMRVQPLVGASAGALVFMLLSSNAVSIVPSSADAWSSPGLLGFVAGFSEPFFVGLVQRVAVISEQRLEEEPTGLVLPRVGARRLATLPRPSVTAKRHPGSPFGRESSKTHSLEGARMTYSAIHNLSRHVT